MKLERMKVAQQVELLLKDAKAGDLVQVSHGELHIVTTATNLETDGKESRLLVNLKTGEMKRIWSSAKILVCEGKLSFRTKWESLPEGIVDDRY